jgi:hypothetical protein
MNMIENVQTSSLNKFTNMIAGLKIWFCFIIYVLITAVRPPNENEIECRYDL